MKKAQAALILCAILLVLQLSGCTAVQRGDSSAADAAEVAERRSYVFEAYGVRFMNPFDERRVHSGETLKAAEDHSNIYLESKNGRLTALLDRPRTAKSETEASAAGFRTVHNPMPVQEGTHIVFASLAEGSDLSASVFHLYMMKSDGSDWKMLLDGFKYGSAHPVDTLGSLVYAATDDDSLLVIDTVTRETKKFAIQGRVDAVSEDGAHVLYRKVEAGYVLPELWMFDIAANRSKEIGPQPERYFLAESRR